MKLLLLLISFGLSSSNLSKWDCGTPETKELQPTYPNNRDNETAVIRAQIWEIHRSDSLFEMSDNSIEDGFEILINTFKEYGILINLSGQDAIFNDSLYYFVEYGRPFDLLSSYSIDTVMNMYYFPNIDYTDGGFTGYGQALAIGGNELFIAGNECVNVGDGLECYDLANTFIPIHESGHCLGLFHPHSTTYGYENVVRPTDYDMTCEVNCEFTSDLLCDTDASTNLKNDVIFDGYDCLFDTSETDSCDYIYHPQIDNFMSYTHFECAYSLTQNQVDRIFTYIENNVAIIQTVISLGDLNDDSEINIYDIIILVTIIISDSEISDLYLWLGDLNYDLVLDILDLTSIINIILE